MEEKKILTTGDIRSLERDGKFTLFAVVSRSSLRRDKNGKNYWDIALMDREGTLEGKIWSNAQWWDARGEKPVTVAEPLEFELFRDLEGKTLGLLGQVTEFRGQTQYNFNGVSFVNQKKYPPHEYVQRSPIPEARLEEEFRELLSECAGPVGDFLSFAFFDKGLWEVFRSCPAAVSHHHAYVGGLLEHTIAVARTARSLARTYSETGMEVNLPLAIGGALLHDIGKMESYEIPPGLKMTVKGTVIDHIVLGYTTFSALAGEFGLDEGIALAIGHILVSHHGCREYGSPVLPATPEAMIVSAADELDFRLFCWKNATDQMEEGREISDYHPSTQRRFWKREETDGL
ncbi:MAG: HD domain-containing protein [Synergistaceae bacterium]|nr:HD domain-containing protein [Synergistaceae bacterium]